MEAVVREKGRITLPRALRKRLGLLQGDRLRFEIERGKVVLKPPREVRTRDIYGMLKGVKVKMEEIEGALGDEVR